MGSEEMDGLASVILCCVDYCYIIKHAYWCGPVISCSQEWKNPQKCGPIVEKQET